MKIEITLLKVFYPPRLKCGRVFLMSECASLRLESLVTDCLLFPLPESVKAKLKG